MSNDIKHRSRAWLADTLNLSVNSASMQVVLGVPSCGELHPRPPGLTKLAPLYSTPAMSRNGQHCREQSCEGLNAQGVSGHAVAELIEES